MPRKLPVLPASQVISIPTLILIAGLLVFILTGWVQAALPTDSGLKLHFDAANIDGDENSSLLDGQTVQLWRDLSGGSHHLSTVRGTPVFIQPGPGYGGLPVVDFQPDDFNAADYLKRNNDPIEKYPFTIFAVVRSATSGNGVIFSLVDQNSREKMAGIRFMSEGKGPAGRLSLFRRNPDWIETSSASAFNDNRLHCITARFISENEARLSVDGVEVASSRVAVSLPKLNRFDIGNNGRSNGTTDPFKGQVAEILVFDRDLPADDRERTESFLSEKWITGTGGIAATQEKIDFNTGSTHARQSQTTIISAVGRSDANFTISKLDLTDLEGFSLRAYLNDREFDPTDATRFPMRLSRDTGDKLKLVVDFRPTRNRSKYEGAIRVLSDAPNAPNLKLSLHASLGNRIGIADFQSYQAEGNQLLFELKNHGKVRVTLDTDRLCRVQFAPNGEFRPDTHPDYFMVQKFDWPAVGYSVEDQGLYLAIRTAGMTIRVQKSPFRLQMYDASNTRLLVKDADREGMFAEGSQRGVFREESGSNHARFGFGSGDHGHSRPLNKSAGYRDFTVTHGRTCVPFFMSTAGYGIFLNTIEKQTSFDDAGGFRTDHFLDYWFMAGDFKQVLGLYAELTGRMNLFPKWGYGFMLSKYGNDHATQDEFLEWIHRLRDEDYPTDCYVFDFGWRGGKFSPHRWDPQRFPDLAAMFAESRRLGFHVGLHNNKGTPEAGNGHFTDPAVAESWWKAHWNDVIKPGYGDWFWPDEFDVAGDNLMANRAAKVVHERWLQETTDQRPMFFTRGGYANHHFASTWSGDIPNQIDEMSEQITGSLALGMSGYPWTSNDLGGFFAKPSDELYIRWVTQFGAFSPIMRAHGHDGREPWLYSERAQANLRKYLKIRYRLFPYIYTTAWQGSSQGIPMMRAMALEHPDDPASWSVDKQYFFGDWLLVAPALSTSDTQVDVWLPPGKWYDFFNPESVYQGGRNISVAATLDQIPVFVKEGAIIPTGPELSYADEKPLDPVTLVVYPGSDSSSYTLYEDDGVSRNYQLSDGFSLTTYEASWTNERSLRFTKGETQINNPGVYKPKLPRSTVIRAIQWSQPPQRVVIDGKEIKAAESEIGFEATDTSWIWSASTQQLIIRFVDDGKEHHVLAEADLPPPESSRSLNER